MKFFRSSSLCSGHNKKEAGRTAGVNWRAGGFSAITEFPSMESASIGKEEARDAASSVVTSECTSSSESASDAENDCNLPARP